MRERSKIFIKVALGIIVILVLIFSIIYFSLNAIVAKGIITFGSEATGTTVEVKGLKLSPLTGNLKIKTLTLSNPKGYKLPNAFVLKSVNAKINILSIFSKEVVIKDIQVSEAAINYEPSPKISNLHEIEANISKYALFTQPFERKLAIDYALIQEALITVSSPLLKDNIKIPMTDYESVDLGGGMVASKTFQKFYSQLFTQIRESVAGVKFNVDFLNHESLFALGNN